MPLETTDLMVRKIPSSSTLSRQGKGCVPGERGAQGSETSLKMTRHMDGEGLSARRAAKCSSWLILFQPHSTPEWIQVEMFRDILGWDRRAVAELGLGSELLFSAGLRAPSERQKGVQLRPGQVSLACGA